MEPEPLNDMVSPGQIMAGAGWLMVASATGRAQGKKHVMEPAKTPEPELFECHTKVRQPVLLPELAEMTCPCRLVPVYVPIKGVAVLLPS